MVLALGLWFALAFAAAVGTLVLVWGILFTLFRTWRAYGILVLALGTLGATAGVATLVLMALMTTRTLRYVGTEAWLVFGGAGFGFLAAPTAAVGFLPALVARRRVRSASAV